MNGGGVSLQAYLHSWLIVWACLSSLTKILLSLFNRPKIISCRKLTIRVKIWVMVTSERSKLVIRRSKIIFKHFLIGGLK